MTRDAVKETKAMIAAMTPELQDGSFIFCATTDLKTASACADHAIGMFIEPEGRSFILPMTDASRLGFDCSLPMKHIILQVYSALDGVGLTAAVARELAVRNIPCNIVAALHHDHVFVPELMANRAVVVLRALQDGSDSRDDSIA